MRLLHSLLAVSVILPVAGFAQNGLIIYKDAPWDQDQFAHGVLYKKVSKFPTVNNIEPMSGAEIRVNSSLVLKDVPFPAGASLQSISEEAQVQQLEALASDWSATLKRFPQVAKALKPRLAAIQNDVTQFRAGKVKEDGVWMSPDALEAKRVKLAKEKQRVATKLEEEAKRRQAMMDQWEKEDAAERKRASDAKIAAENAQFDAERERLLVDEINKQGDAAAKRAEMKPAERLSTDTWVTPPNLSQAEIKDFEDTMNAAREELSKSKDLIGFGRECQRFVLITPDRVLAFRAPDLLPTVKVEGEETPDAAPMILLSSPAKKKGIDSYPLDGSDATSLESVKIATGKDGDAKKLSGLIGHLLELAGAKPVPDGVKEAKLPPGTDRLR